MSVPSKTGFQVQIMKCAAGSVFVLAMLASGIARAQESFEPVNVTPSGTAGNGHSANPAISADGRFVVFWSDSSDLVPGDTNAFGDVFVRDLASGSTVLVSANPNGQPGNGWCEEQAQFGKNGISADARCILFRSHASDLVPGDTNGIPDLFVRDRLTGTTERVSLTDSEGELSRPARDARISGDGNRILFRTDAPQLGSTHDHDNRLYVRDRALGTTRRVDVLPSGNGSTGTGAAVLSNDGREVIFHGVLSPEAPWPGADFVHDLGSATTHPLFPTSTSASMRVNLQPIALSPNGRWLAAEADDDLDTSDGYWSQWQSNLWILDRVTGRFLCATRPTEPEHPWWYTAGVGWHVNISEDGSSVLFMIDEQGLLDPADLTYEVIERNLRIDAAVYATRTGHTIPATSSPYGGFDASDDHSSIAFDSYGRHAPHDTLEVSNVFVMRRVGASAQDVCTQSLAACPCGQSGLPGRGCGNSFDPRGGVLIARGNPSISDDTLRFTLQSTDGTQLLLQGTELSNGASGTPFAQGVACVGGASVPIRIPRDFTPTYVEIGATTANSPRLSQLGSVESPGTRYYQVWYRDHQIAACTATGGNLTNALRVEWRP